MCGRFTRGDEYAALKERFGLQGDDPGAIPSYNQAPGQDAPVLPAGEPRRLELMRWGLVPHWAKDAGLGPKAINARTETVHERPAFKTAFKRRRCLVPADGFYEWAKGPGGKNQPYHFSLARGGAFAFAGLWDQWTGGETPLHSFTIITTTANELVARVHGRMPVILAPGDEAAWLDAQLTDSAKLHALLRPYPAADMKSTAVSPRVGDVNVQGPELLQPAPVQGSLF